MEGLQSMLSAREPWAPHLGPERVVEGIHYGWLMKDHIARYKMALEHCRGKSVLDVATGTGYGANVLRAGGAERVVAVDCNHYTLAYARERYGTDGLVWLEADAHHLPLAAEFDVAISFETIEHLIDPDLFLDGIRRALKPGGLLMISTPLNEEGTNYISPCHEKEYTLNEFRELLERHFSSVEMFGQRRILAENVRPLGKLQDGFYRTGSGPREILFRLMNVVNKGPNALLAWLSGNGEAKRRRILPIDAPKSDSKWLLPEYFIMIGVCRP